MFRLGPLKNDLEGPLGGQSEPIAPGLGIELEETYLTRCDPYPASRKGTTSHLA
jgi:hypothetical protein